ncbi:type III-B CRISPR-associated protein Cas10/Cmr2 [Candidatus Parcubacteria bacterium]|nr:MAG: type III-B CRISPR-associated protein Cas10/Cmr2 [Candidatus Parcubacteria bacterium]
MSSVNSVFEEIYATYKADFEKIYLSLWRELLSLLEQRREEDGMGQLWEVLPADTRVPDHSIWEHRRVTSAIAAALPEPAFLLFAIGPVQSFIAAARKAQDLWAGSYLLSYLSWQAMKVVAEAWGPDSIIFPDLCGQPFVDLWLREEKGLKFVQKPSREELSSPTLPNRFLAILPARAAREMAQEIEERVKSAFKEICFAVKQRVERDVGIDPDAVWDDIWERQVSNFLETYWAVLPWENDYRQFLQVFKFWCEPQQESWEFDTLVEQYEKTGYTPNIGTCYSKLYMLTERGLGSRKATRDFEQQVEHHFKCTMFAELEPVHLEGQENFRGLREFWNETMLPKLPMLRSGERLSAIALTKRLAAAYYFKASKEQKGLDWDIETSFPSTSTVATAAFKQRILDALSGGDMGLFKILNEYTNQVRKLLGDDRARSLPLPKVAWVASRAHKRVPDLPRDFARLDGDWLFEESFNKRALQRELAEKWRDDLSGMEMERQKAVKALDKLLEWAKKNSLREPSRYYAVIVMDGDHMGKWLAGELGPSLQDILHPQVWRDLQSDPRWKVLGGTKRPLNPALHLAISKALRDYSLHTVREIVEKEHLGKLIYAGGDDVLAFVSLRDLLEVMRKLRAFFTGALKGDENQIDWMGGSGFVRTKTGFRLTMGMTASASMGVAIAHHVQDLGQVLDAARSEERRAKDVLDRNAFSIALMKRSGGRESFGAKWYYEKNGTLCVDTVECLIHWRDAFARDDVSPRFAYIFRHGMRALARLPQEAIRKESHRLIDRHLNARLSEDERGEISFRLLDEGLLKLFEAGISLDELAKFLDLAVFLSREENQ